MSKAQYNVLAYVYEADYEGDDPPYGLCIVFQSEDCDEAVAYLKNVEVTKEVPELRLEFDDDYEAYWLATKDEHGIYSDSLIF